MLKISKALQAYNYTIKVQIEIITFKNNNRFIVIKRRIYTNGHPTENIEAVKLCFY